MQKRLAIIWLSVLLAACAGKESAQFVPPQFLETDVEVEGSNATFSCLLSSDRVESCGILLDGVRWEGTMAGKQLTATVKGLEMGHRYTWKAFVQAGNQVVQSEERSFEADNGNVPIPDPVFKKYLVNLYDMDQDGGLSREEASYIVSVSICTDQVYSVKGIEFMSNLEGLFIAGSAPNMGKLSELDIRDNPRLKDVFCIHNRIAAIDLSRNPQLKTISCWGNCLKELDVSHNPVLREIACAQNFMTDLDVSRNPYLEELHFNDTFVSSIDISQNPRLKKISCWNTLLTQLDVKNNPQLESLECWDLAIISLDVSANPKLTLFDCSPSSSLEVVYVAKGQIIPGVTENRTGEYVPDHCVIVEKSVE